MLPARIHRADRPAGRTPETDDAGVIPADQEVRPSWRAVPRIACDRGQVRRHDDQTNDPLGGSEVHPEVGGALERLKGRGRPLPTGIARSMGVATGADLDQVRIHTGPEPAALARSMQAKAFTLGQDIYFGAGTYAPDTHSGQHLLAHELAHTVQRGGSGGSGPRPVIGRGADPAEHEADRVADGVLKVVRLQSAKTDEAMPGKHGAGASADLPAVRRLLSSTPAPGPDVQTAYDATPSPAQRLVRTQVDGSPRLRRKIGFEAELMIPSLGKSGKKLKYEKDELWVTDELESFLDGGVPYGTDMGGKDADVRLDSDHGASVDRTPIVDKLAELGFVSGQPYEPRTKIEFVTTAVDELAPGANKRFREVGKSLTDTMTDALAKAQSGKMQQLAAPAKAGYRTGVPVKELRFWLGEAAYAKLKPTVDEYLSNGIQDEVYLQATVGVVPTALMSFFARSALPGGKVEVAPPSESRQKIFEIVAEIVAQVETAFAKYPEGHWVKSLDVTSQQAFLGLLGLCYSYMLGDTLHQTTGGTNSVPKNAVPFLIKMSPYRLIATSAPHLLVKNPPPKEFVRQLGEMFKKTRYLQLPYWVEEARKDDAPTAVGEGKISEKLDARPRADRLITGDYTDFLEAALLGSHSGDISVVVGKELPGPDKPTTKSGDINVFYELYNQKGIPLEYRAIKNRYKVTELLPALAEIISDVRQASLGELTEEQRAAVMEGYKGDG